MCKILKRIHGKKNLPTSSLPYAPADVAQHSKPHIKPSNPVLRTASRTLLFPSLTRYSLWTTANAAISFTATATSKSHQKDKNGTIRRKRIAGWKTCTFLSGSHTIKDIFMRGHKNNLLIFESSYNLLYKTHPLKCARFHFLYLKVSTEFNKYK